MPRSILRSSLKTRRPWLALAALAAGAGCGALGAWQLHTSTQSRVQQRLDSNAELAVGALEQRLAAYSEALEQLASSLNDQLAETPSGKSGEDQQLLAEQALHVLSQSRLQGLQALSLVRAAGPDTQSVAGEPPLSFVVSAIWPIKGNELLLGSTARQPVAVWQSLLSSWRTQSTTISGAYHLYQAPDSPLGVLIRQPVYAAAEEPGGKPPQLLGTVNASVRLKDLARSLVPFRAYPHVAMRIQDQGPALQGLASTVRPAQTLFTGPLWEESASDAAFASAKPLERTLRVHDRQWLLQFKSAPGSVAGLEKALPWLILALGTLVGLVLALGVSGWWQSRLSWLQRIRSSTQARQESDARFQAMCEQAALGVVEVDLNTRGIISVNSHYCLLTGYASHELVERNALEMLDPEDRAECAALMDRLNLEQFQHASDEFCLRAKDGSQLWVELNAFLSGPADARRLLVLVQDISGRKRLEQMERQGHQQLRNLMQRLPVGLVMEDHNGRLVYWNEEFLRLAGQIGLPDSSSALWWQRMYPDAAEHERVVQRWQNAQSKARAALKAEKSLLASLESDAWDVQAGDAGAYTIEGQEMQLVGTDGVRRPVLVSGVMQDEGCLMVLLDQTQRKEAEQEVKRLAFYDALTNLPNRRLMADRLQRALDVSRRNLHFGGVVLLDIDNFKAFNEAFGLEQGDLLLVGLSKRIKDLLPAGMTLARQGGDDFVLLLEDLGPDSVVAAARLAQEAANWMRVLREPIEVAGTPRQITVSMGLSLFGGQVMTVEEVLRRAEMAMYQAKSQGRNASCFFDPQLQSVLQERRALELDMRQGMDAGEFELFYQPQVEMGRVIGAEALLRWKHPQRGYVPPVQFIPLAEETGFILPLGEWVLQAACHQLSCWAKHPRYGQLVLSVNVSPSQFLQPGFVDQVLKALAEHGADASKLKLELTEGMLVTDVDDTIAKMARLKSYGIGFSLDDFGTGYSSLAYLKRLPLDQLKIDRSFVRDVLTDPNDAAIARTIVALAKSLGLHVIAEGVETLAQCRFLEGIRCYAWQGYLMSPAVPPLEFERLVTHGSVPGSGAPALSPASMR